MDNNLVLISSAIVFRKDKEKNKDYWFLVKNSENGEWEFPHTVVRKVESSVRAAIRMMGEQGGMTIRVLEEAGRAGGVTTLNDKTLPQRHLYYVARRLSDSEEAIGFEEFEWFEFSQASRKLKSKRDKTMLKAARDEVEKWRKKRAKAKAKARAIREASQ